jgi:hypothetical protein
MLTPIRFSEDGKRALVRVTDDTGAEIIGIAHKMTDGSLRGTRWECSPGHLEAFADVYAKRFPVVAQ